MIELELAFELHDVGLKPREEETGRFQCSTIDYGGEAGIRKARQIRCLIYDCCKLPLLKLEGVVG